MKTNAPERIWIDLATDLPKLSGHINKDSIEYTRTDAFIEKAAEWLMESLEKYISADGEYTVYYEEMFEDFKKAMKL